MKKEYYLNLNTIRCIAAFSVVFYHWVPDKTITQLGKIGVDVFFVLSGFLITEILLRNKDQSGKDPARKFQSVGIFYAKRALRIFPIYYLLITLFFFLKYPPLGKDWIWLFTYTTNFLLYFKQMWIHPLSQVWSLAVEEQFYIVWPFLILFVRRAWHLYLILIVIAASLLFIVFNFRGNPFFFMLPFSCMSTLGLGALLAFFKNRMESRFMNMERLFIPLMAACTILFVVFYHSLNFIAGHLLIGFFAFGLIGFAVISKNRTFNALFSNRITGYLGKISYGIYLYHVPIPWLVRNLNGTEDKIMLHVPKILPAFHNGYAILFENLAVLLVVTSLSWFIIESPINSFKSLLQKPKLVPAYEPAEPAVEIVENPLF